MTDDHDGDHVTYDDAVLSAVRIGEARARHGRPPARPCSMCPAPATAGFYCDQHDAEVNALLDRTWPPVIE